MSLEGTEEITATAGEFSGIPNVPAESGTFSRSGNTIAVSRYTMIPYLCLTTMV